MIKFPLTFTVSAHATSSPQWSGKADGLSPIPVAVPKEFMGSGGAYSPEDLFALAVLNCLIATFKVYAEKMKISFREIDAKAALTVDKEPKSATFSMTRVEIFLDLKGAVDPDRAKAVLEQAARDCAVANSIRSEKTLSITLSP